MAASSSGPLGVAPGTRVLQISHTVSLQDSVSTPERRPNGREQTWRNTLPLTHRRSEEVSGSPPVHPARSLLLTAADLHELSWEPARSRGFGG